MAKDLVAKVRVTADVKSAERSIRDLENSLKKLGSETKAANAEASASASASAAKTSAAVQQSAAEINKSLASVKPIKIEADGSKAKKAAEEVGKAVKDLKGKNVKIEADGSRASAAVKKVQSALKGLKPPTPIKIEAKTSAAVASVNKLSGSYTGLATAMSATTAAAAASTAAISTAAATNATAASANNASASLLGMGVILKGLVGPLAAVGAGVGSVGTAIKFAMDGSTLRSQTEALKRNVEAQNVIWDGYLEKIKQVAKDQITTADIIKSSSQALLLGIPADKIADLMDVARVSAVATGAEIGKAFDDLAVGIGRASPMILDNLGLVIKLGAVNEDAAAAIGKTVEELTAEEKKLALLNSVLETGAARILLFNDAQSRSAEGFARMTAAMGDFVDDAKIGLSEASDVIFTITDGINSEAEALEELNRELGHATDATDKAAKSTYGFYEILSEISKANLSSAIGLLGSRWAEYNIEANKASAAAATLVKENQALEVSIQNLSAAQQNALRTEIASVDAKSRSADLTAKISEGLATLKEEQEKATAAAAKNAAITERANELKAEESGWLKKLTTDYRSLAEAQLFMENQHKSLTEAVRAAQEKSAESSRAMIAAMREQGVVLRDDLIKSYEKLFAQEAKLDEMLRKGEISLQAHAQKTKLNAEALQELNAKAQAAGYSLSKLKEEVSGSTEAMDPAAAAADKLSDAYDRLGLVMKSDISDALKENEDLLRAQAIATGYSSDEYRKLEIALNDEVRALKEQSAAQLQANDATEAGVSSLGGLASGADDAARSLDGYKSSADGVASSIGRAAEATDRLAESQKNLSSWDTGNINLGGTIGGGTFGGFTPIEEFSASQWATYTQLTGITRSMWQQSESSAGNSQWS